MFSNAWLRPGIFRNNSYAMSKKKYDNIHPNWILMAAQMDKISADMLYEKSIPWMCSENEKENFASVSFFNSAIILYSLSIEHGLKALLSLGGKKQISGHDHKRLFQSLPTTIQERIKEELSEERFKVTFDKYLEENKNDFIEWRYSYEKSVMASSDFLKVFAAAIIKVGESCKEANIPD